MSEIRRLLDGSEQRHDEGQLGGRLAAGDRDATQQRAVAAQLGQHLVHRHGAGLGIGILRADVEAAIAVGAKILLPAHPPLVQPQGTARAARHTVATVIAQPYGVGVVAARAAKVAALQEQHQPVARPIHAGEGQQPADDGGTSHRA
ncbi:hypothetical protein D3C84_881210 [compost metagenome]